MTREEYQKKASVILEQERKLKSELYKLRKEYVASNCVIPAGTKVKVCSWGGNKKDVGILLRYEFRHDDIRPVVAKIKKDGTAHKSARIFVWGDDTIEPIE